MGSLWPVPHNWFLASSESGGPAKAPLAEAPAPKPVQKDLASEAISATGGGGSERRVEGGLRVDGMGGLAGGSGSGLEAAISPLSGREVLEGGLWLNEAG